MNSCRRSGDSALREAASINALQAMKCPPQNFDPCQDGQKIAQATLTKRIANPSRRRLLQSPWLPTDGHPSAFLLPTLKIGQHRTNVARKLLCVGFPGAANFLKNRIELHSSHLMQFCVSVSFVGGDPA